MSEERAFKPGDRLDSYEIIEFLAQGGMGAVYSARNVVTRERRAIKVLAAHIASDRDYVARFERELRLAAALNHPGLVRTYDPGEREGTLYLPMELLEGKTLRDLLKETRPLDPATACAVLLPVCNAVAALHDAGIIHRDLKPANLFLASAADGVVVPKVLDLGAARSVASEEHLTQAGSGIGTMAYMALEQLRGQQDLDARVDQYALGVIAYEMLCGMRPYESDSASHAGAKLLEGKPFPPLGSRAKGVAPDLIAAVERAIARERDQRFLSVRDFAAQLLPFARTGPIRIDLGAHAWPNSESGEIETLSAVLVDEGSSLSRRATESAPTFVLASPTTGKVVEAQHTEDPTTRLPSPSPSLQPLVSIQKPLQPVRPGVPALLFVSAFGLMVLVGATLLWRFSSSETAHSADGADAHRVPAAVALPLTALRPAPTKQIAVPSQPGRVTLDAGAVARTPRTHSLRSTRPTCVPRPGLPCLQ